jgi:hypothetical protein
MVALVVGASARLAPCESAGRGSGVAMSLGGLLPLDGTLWGDLRMAQADQAAGTPAAQPSRWPRLLLLIVALIEFLGGLGDLPILAGNLDEIPGPGLGGAIIIATIILQPIAAAAALFFIVRANITWALLSMAVVILLNWASFLPSIQLHGLDFGADGTGGLVTFVLVILPPILVLAIAGLALTNMRPTLASLLAVLPTFIDVLGKVAFGIGVAIYGF